MVSLFYKKSSKAFPVKELTNLFVHDNALCHCFCRIIIIIHPCVIVASVIICKASVNVHDFQMLITCNSSMKKVFHIIFGIYCLLTFFHRLSFPFFESYCQIAGEGFEPLTSGLCVRQTPTVLSCHKNPRHTYARGFSLSYQFHFFYIPHGAGRRRYRFDDARLQQAHPERVAIMQWNNDTDAILFRIQYRITDPV